MTTLIDTVKPTESYLEEILPQALVGRGEGEYLDAYLGVMVERLKKNLYCTGCMVRGGLLSKRNCWSAELLTLVRLWMAMWQLSIA